MAADMDDNPAPISIDDDVEWLTEQIEALKQLGQKDEVERRREVRLQHQMGYGACRTAAAAGALQFARAARRGR